MAFDRLALSLSAWGKDQKTPRLGVQNGTLLNKSHTDTLSLTPVTNPVQQPNYHIPLANSLSPLKKRSSVQSCTVEIF